MNHLKQFAHWVLATSSYIGLYLVILTLHLQYISCLAFLFLSHSSDLLLLEGILKLNQSERKNNKGRVKKKIVENSTKCLIFH